MDNTERTHQNGLVCRYWWTMAAWADQYIGVNLCFEGSNKASKESQVLFLLIKQVYLL